MMNELSQILETLKQPEYIHVLLNPLPVYGMAIGALLLLGGLLFKSRDVQVASLVLIMGIGIMTWPVVDQGRDSYDRVLAMSNEDGQSWLKAHKRRAENAQYFFYGTAVIALGTLLAARWGKSLAKYLVVLTFVFTVVCCAAGAWISHAGGQIRHSEFRSGPP